MARGGKVGRGGMSRWPSPLIAHQLVPSQHGNMSMLQEDKERLQGLDGWHWCACAVRPSTWENATVKIYTHAQYKRM